MNITKYTCKCTLDKKLGHFVHVTFSSGFGLYGANKPHHEDDNIEIHGWTFEPHDIDLELYPQITRFNLMPLVAENEIDWVILPKLSPKMNNSLEQADRLLNYYEATQIKLREEIAKLQKEANNDWLMSLDMYMYCLRYTYKLLDVYKINPWQFYKDEILEMMHRFEKHAANDKDSRLFKLNISIIEYCTEAYKEMEKIPTKA